MVYKHSLRQRIAWWWDTFNDEWLLSTRETRTAKLQLIRGTWRMFWTMWRMRPIITHAWECHECHTFHETELVLRMVTTDGGEMAYATGDQVSFNPPCPTCHAVVYKSFGMREEGPGF